MSSSEQQVEEQELRDLAEQLGQCMIAKGLKLASAESCTGGWLAQIITAIPGSSAWFTPLALYAGIATGCMPHCPANLYGRRPQV